MTIIIEDEIVSYKANLFPVGIWMEIPNWVSLRYYHMTIIIEDEIVSYKANLFPVGIWMEIPNW